MSNSFKKGDWLCPNCDDHQFARNKFCRKCREPKPGNVVTSYQYHSEKRGDWYCPQCTDHQFASRTVCRSCGAARPESYNPEGFNHINTDANTRVKPKPEFRPGDWICPQCNDHQFASRLVCRNCQTPNPVKAGETEEVTIVKVDNAPAEKVDNTPAAEKVEQTSKENDEETK